MNSKFSRLTSLTVSDESSARTVPVPVTIASHWLRRIATSDLEISFVIHFELPSSAATFPSRLAAIFIVIYGLELSLFFSHARLVKETSSFSSPCSTMIPASISACAPPWAIGFGSQTAKTTFLSPAGIIALVQGGVFP